MKAHSAAIRLTTSSAVNIGGISTVLGRALSRAATLMLKRYGENAHMESAARADELAADGDHDGAAVWRRVADAVAQLASTTPSGPVH